MKKFLEYVYEIIETFVISLVLFLFVYLFLAFPEIVVGASMEPTLYQGERLLVERLSPKLGKLERGDVIIFNPPGNNGIDYVKRIVGLPNETLVIKNCKLFLVNDNLENELQEEYLAPKTCSEGEGLLITVPDNAYYVLGDNREHSSDSRKFGPLGKERVVGKVIFRFWPLNRFKAF